MNSRDWADWASVYRAGAEKAAAIRTATGQATMLDLILAAMKLQHRPGRKMTFRRLTVREVMRLRGQGEVFH